MSQRESLCAAVDACPCGTPSECIPGSEGCVVEAERAQRSFRLSHCAECETPFPEPVPEDQAFDDWGDAAADEIAYLCGRCADEFDGTAANAR